MRFTRNYQCITRNAPMREVPFVGGTEKWWRTWKQMSLEPVMVWFEWQTKSRACAIKSLRWVARVSALLRPRHALVAEALAPGLNARPATCGTCSAWVKIRERCSPVRPNLEVDHNSGNAIREVNGRTLSIGELRVREGSRLCSLRTCIGQR